MSQEAYLYDYSDLGVVVVGSREAVVYDYANAGKEAIPTIFLDQAQAGWGYVGSPKIALGQISAFSEGFLYDYADVTT